MEKIELSSEKWEMAKEEKKLQKSRCKLYNQGAAESVPIKNPPKNWEQNIHEKMLWLIQSDYVEKYLRLA